MKLRFLIFSCAILLISFSASATHIIGGEITYTYQGNDNYQIVLTAYRDCMNGIPPFDNPAAIGIFDSSNIMISSKHVNLLTSSPASNSNNSCIPVSPSNICYEKGTYILNVNLPKRPGGYQIAYQRCCRTIALTNVANAQGTGTTYYATIPDSINAENNSPTFNNQSFTNLCVNVPFTFDNSAVDPDGDSLVYSLNTPLNGASDIDPEPDPILNPPYSEISWLAPYSIGDVFGGSPLTIDALSGILSGTPNTPGLFTYGVSVKEYRNGNYIGETRRDFQIYVLSSTYIGDILYEDVIKYSSSEKLFKINPDLILENAQLKIYDVLGKEIFSVNNISSNTISLKQNLSSSQLYFYRFVNDAKIISNGKFSN